MKYLFLSLILFIAVPIHQSQARNPVDEIVAVLQRMPHDTRRVSHADLEVIADAIYRVSRGSQLISWQILVSIAHKESAFHKGAIGPTKDVGLMQISPRNIKRMGLDRKRLLTDPEYSLEVALELLEYNKTRFHRYPFWIGIYQVGTRIHDPHRRLMAKNYHRSIQKRLKTIAKIQQDLHTEGKSLFALR